MKKAWFVVYSRAVKHGMPSPDCGVECWEGTDAEDVKGALLKKRSYQTPNKHGVMFLVDSVEGPYTDREVRKLGWKPIEQIVREVARGDMS